VSAEGESWWLRVVDGEARGFGAALARGGLWVLSVGYGLALRAHLAGYRLGIAKRTRLPVPVISVGNLTLGGTGKTTAALAVARWLQENGRRAAFLSRGYRGAGERKAVVVSKGSGPILDVETAGDEPYMVAKALPEICVVVGKDRRRTGTLAVEALGAEAIVLDDGFQYQRLERDVDVVLVDALAPFGYDLLVPRGLLREPARHLARADAVWLTHCDLVRREVLEAIRTRVQRLAPRARVWETMHVPSGLRRLEGEGELEPGALRGRRVCALSSLGNPLAFERSLAQLGAEVVSAVRFPDHHRYEAGELRRTLEAMAASAEWVVTTEKDAVRLPVEALEKPTWVLKVELSGRPGGSKLSEELTCLLSTKGKI